MNAIGPSLPILLIKIIKIVNINHEPNGPITNFLKIVEFISQTGYDIKALDLSNAKLGLAGCQTVANIMSTNSTIQTLNLSGAELGPVNNPSGLKLIGTSLKNNTTLIHLILAGLKCSLSVLATLSGLLSNNNTIQYLGLQGCQIADNLGIDVLICSLKFNRSLIKLDLDQFYYDNEGNNKLVESILIAVENNNIIEEIILSYNSVDYDLLAKLQAKLDSNKLAKLQ